MRAKLWKKLMSLTLAVALVITMMPVIPGAVQQAHAAVGSSITITDSTGNQLVLDTTEGGSTANHTGAGYAYDVETNTLTLNGFNGKQILSNGDFNLHLIGENTITLTDEIATGNTIYGLQAKTGDGSYCGVTVTADDGGTLNITGEDLTTSTYVWYASTNFTSGTVDIDVSITSGILYGIYGGMTFTKDEEKAAVLKVNVVNKGDNAAIGLGNGGILIENRDNVTINSEAKADYQATALSILQIIDAAPVITAKATKLDGTIGAKQRAVSEPIYYMQLTEGGKVTLEGMIVVYEGRISWNENTIVTTPANSAYYWEDAKEIDQYAATDYVYMKNLDGTPVTKAVFAYSADPTRELKYNGEGIVSVPEGKVGKAMKAVYLHRYIVGELDSRSWGDSNMIYEITEGSLPAGLTLHQHQGRINGTPTASVPAGEIAVKATDRRGTYYDSSDDQSITFTVPYGEIVEPDRFITVGGTKVEIKSDASGAGWEYDADTKTLTLNGYTGGNILSEVDFNLHLKGTNTIALDDAMATGGRIYGLKAETESGAFCTVTVTADDGGTLNITGEDLTTSTFVWYASTNFTSGTVDIDVSITSGILYGIYGGMTFTEDETNSATLNVNVVNKGDSAAIGLGNGGILIENRDNVTINSEAKADYQATALSILQIIDAAPFITAKATKLDGTIGAKQRAVSEPIYYMQLTEGGKVTLEGMIVVYEGRISWNENTIVTTPENSAYYWEDAKLIDQYAGTDYVFMKDLEGNPVTKAVFEYSTDPIRTLQYNGEGIVSIPSGKMGTAIKAVYLHRYIVGELDSRSWGSSNMVYEITEGSLPAGLTLHQYQGRISGTPTAKADAGEITVKATDHRGTYNNEADDQSITFTVPYGAIASARPVTAVTLDKDELSVNQGETVEFTATVTPLDASYAEVSVTRQNFNVVGINSIGDPVDGVTTIRIVGGTNVGEDILTVTSKDTGVKDNITVYVKEEKPNASQDDTHITGLIANQKYTVNGTEYVADIYGKIAIDPAWRKTTVSIIRPNAEPKCNSDAQELAIAAKPIQSSWITLEYDSAAYDGTEKTPAVTVKDGETTLVKDTDYTVTYTDHTNAGTAKVTVTGKGDYSGTIEKTFNITGISIAAATLTLSQDEYDYDGTQCKPGVTVVLDGTPLAEGTDYEVVYDDNINAGNGQVIVKGKGNYEGSAYKAFVIKPISLEGKAVTLEYDSVEYDGTAKKPLVTEVEGVTAEDYTVSYNNNINAGTANVVIEGYGNYTGTINKAFTISKVNLASCTITLSQDMFEFTGTSKAPTITVKNGNKKLTADTDYVITGDTSGIAAGTYTFTITGKGNYEGAVSKNFTISACTHEWDAGVVTDPATCKETGLKLFTCTICTGTKTEIIPIDKDAHPIESIKDLPAKAATCKETGLTAGEQCEACGMVTVPQTEVPKLTTHTYDAGVVTTVPTCKTEGVKTYTCEVCDGTKTEPVPIDKDAHPAGSIKDLPAKAATCKETGLTAGKKCEDCGTVTVPQTEVPKLTTHTYGAGVITKAATCTTQGVKTYTCTVCSGTKTDIIATDENAHPAERIKDLPAKAATCKETGLTAGKKCEDCGTVTVPQTEVPKLTTHTYDAGVVTTAPTCKTEGVKTYTCEVCDGTKTEPVPIDKDAHPAGSIKNLPAKAATCKETGLTAGKKCDDCDTVTVPQTEVPKLTTHTYDAGVVTTAPTCKTEGVKTYTCEVCDGTKTEPVPIDKDAHPAGSIKDLPAKAATLTATGLTAGKQCADCGGKLVQQNTIAAIGTVKLSYEKKVYTGKTLAAPKLTVTDTVGKALVSGTDYTVTGLAGKKSVGRYKVTVTFKGNYAGSKTLYFNIVPKKTTSAKAVLYGYDDVKFSWSKVTGASGYLVSYKKGSGSWSKAVATTGTSYKKANLSDGVKYTFKVVPYYKEKNGTTKYYDANQYKTAYTYTLKKVSGVKVAKSGTKVKVSWTNISGETGYQISKMTKKSATQKKPLTYKTTSGKYKKLSATKGKTYYYKVRAYKNVNGKNIYGPWSTVKAYKRK